MNQANLSVELFNASLFLLILLPKEMIPLRIGITIITFVTFSIHGIFTI
jgi:hypothetical protein